MKILVTGTAGFIGYHLVRRLVSRGDDVVGIDSINEYYDINLKYNRLGECGVERRSIEYGKKVSSIVFDNYSFIQANLEDKSILEQVFKDGCFDRVCNLAAQAGVRYSLTHPQAYIDSNIVGFTNILECSRHYKIQHLAYASSSSVYGLNEQLPFSTMQNVDHPVSLYAATKKANELFAHAYSHLYGLPTTGLRFFTVYGPWGRPDMALFLFTKAILNGDPIDLFNNGEMRRDFTYIDDIVEGIVRVIDKAPSGDPIWSGARPDPASSSAPYRVFNIGNSQSVKLLSFVKAIEESLGKKATLRMLPMQAGDVPATWADVSELEKEMGYKPCTPVAVGVKKFVEWYNKYYHIRP